MYKDSNKTSSASLNILDGLTDQKKTNHVCFMLLINYFIGFAELKDEDENRIQRGMDNWNGKCTGD